MSFRVYARKGRGVMGGTAGTLADMKEIPMLGAPAWGPEL